MKRSNKIWYVLAVVLSLLAARAITAQTVTFPRSTPSITVHWTYDPIALDTVDFKVVWSTGSVSGVRGLSRVLQHSVLGDSTVICVFAVDRDLPHNISNSSNLVTVKFRDGVIPPVSAYTPIPYIANASTIKAWKRMGSVVDRASSLIIYGPKTTPVYPGRIERAVNLELAGKYRISAWAYGDSININGYKQKLNDRAEVRIDQYLSLPQGQSVITISAPCRLAEIDSLRVEYAGVIVKPLVPMNVRITP